MDDYISSGDESSFSDLEGEYEPFQPQKRFEITKTHIVSNEPAIDLVQRIKQDMENKVDTTKVNDAKSLIDVLEKEAWKLIYLLERPTDDPIIDFLMANDKDDSKSEVSINKRITSDNEELIRLEVVVKWLEEKHESDKFLIDPKFDDDFGSLGGLVASSDPKEAAEQRFWKDVWWHLRAGKQKEIANICKRNKNFGVLASFMGGELVDHDNLKKAGNVHRDLWKKCCWEIASNNDLSIYQRAVYGVLSGNFGQLEQICKTWEDQVWASFYILTENYRQSLLKQEEPFPFDEEAVLPDVSPLDLTLPVRFQSVQEIFDIVSAQIPRTGSDDQYINNTFHRLYTFLILNDLESIVPFILEVVDDLPDQDLMQKALLGFATHVLLYWVETGYDIDNEIMDKVLQRYVSYLIGTLDGNDNNGSFTNLASAFEAINFYVSKISSPEERAELLTNLMISLRDPEHKRIYVELAQQNGVDTSIAIDQAITTLVDQNVQTLLGADPVTLIDLLVTPSVTGREKDSEKKDKATPFLEKLVDALDLLSFDRLNAQSLFFTNLILRALLSGYFKIVSVQGFSKPNEVSECSKALYKAAMTVVQRFASKFGKEIKAIVDDASLCPELSQSSKEFSHYQRLLSTITEFDQWRSMFQQSGSNSEQDDHSVGLLSLEEKNAMRDETSFSSSLSTRPVVSRSAKSELDLLGASIEQQIIETLKLEIVEPSDDGSAPEISQTWYQDMMVFKSFVVPVFVNFLFEFYSCAENHLGIMSIANIIADEQDQLYRFFDEPALQQLLQHFARSATNNLKTGSHDPIGFLAPFDRNFPHYA